MKESIKKILNILAYFISFLFVWWVAAALCLGYIARKLPKEQIVRLQEKLDNMSFDEPLFIGIGIFSFVAALTIVLGFRASRADETSENNKEIEEKIKEPEDKITLKQQLKSVIDIVSWIVFGTFAIWFLCMLAQIIPWKFLGWLAFGILTLIIITLSGEDTTTKRP